MFVVFCVCLEAARLKKEQRENYSSIVVAGY